MSKSKKKQVRKIDINEILGIMEFGVDYLKEFNIPLPLMRIIESTVKLSVIMNNRGNEKKISDDLHEMMSFNILTIAEINKYEEDDISNLHDKLGRYCSLYAKCISDNIHLFEIIS